MKIHRIYCKDLSTDVNNYFLDQSQSLHASKVLRLKVGDNIEVFNGLGRSAISQIISISKNKIEIKIDSQIKEEKKNKNVLCAIVPLIKKENFYFMLQKLTELGLDKILIYKPHHLDQSLIRKNHEKIFIKSKEVLISACKQSGINFLPDLSFNKNLEYSIQELKKTYNGLIYAFDLDAGQSFSQIDFTESACFVTGPESGFSQNELDLLKNQNIETRLIGNSILRAETAPIVISSLIQNHFGRI